jgi:hypothetical protein
MLTNYVSRILIRAKILEKVLYGHHNWSIVLDDVWYPAQVLVTEDFVDFKIITSKLLNSTINPFLACDGDIIFSKGSVEIKPNDLYAFTWRFHGATANV